MIFLVQGYHHCNSKFVWKYKQLYRKIVFPSLDLDLRFVVIFSKSYGVVYAKLSEALHVVVRYKLKGFGFAVSNDLPNVGPISVKYSLYLPAIFYHLLSQRLHE